MPRGPFPSARDDSKRAGHLKEQPEEPHHPISSSAYRLAYEDIEFLLHDELRPVRLQLELLKPEMMLKDAGIHSTVVVFGSARLVDRETAQARLDAALALASARPDDPVLIRDVAQARRLLANSRYYEEARILGRIAAQASPSGTDFVVLTGGGPGIMEAANRGAWEMGAKSVGLNIVLPFEQRANEYVTPELSFLFHYFALRKMHFLQRARALVIFPGGYGTLDEMFEAATLAQTGKIDRFPFLLFGRDFWTRLIDFDLLIEEGMIAPEDKDLFQIVETAEEAWSVIANFWGLAAGDEKAG